MWFGWSAMNAPLCGSETPWQPMQNELLWHLSQRPGEASATLECCDIQPAGCGICSPWHSMQLFVPWHLTNVYQFFALCCE